MVNAELSPSCALLQRLILLCTLTEEGGGRSRSKELSFEGEFTASTVTGKRTRMLLITRRVFVNQITHYQLKWLFLALTIQWWSVRMFFLSENTVKFGIRLIWNHGWSFQFAWSEKDFRPSRVKQEWENFEVVSSLTCFALPPLPSCEVSHDKRIAARELGCTTAVDVL